MEDIIKWKHHSHLHTARTRCERTLSAKAHRYSDSDGQDWSIISPSLPLYCDRNISIAARTDQFRLTQLVRFNFRSSARYSSGSLEDNWRHIHKYPCFAGYTMINAERTTQHRAVFVIAERRRVNNSKISDYCEKKATRVLYQRYYGGRRGGLSGEKVDSYGNSCVISLRFYSESIINWSAYSHVYLNK